MSKPKYVFAGSTDEEDITSEWIHLRPKLHVRLQMCSFNSLVGLPQPGEGIVVEAFSSEINRWLIWDDEYTQHSMPCLTKHGLTPTEEEQVHQAARSFAPQLPVWSEKVK